MIPDDKPAPKLIASRILHCAAPDYEEITVSLYEPMPASDAHHFECRYSIVARGRAIHRWAAGFDSMQALRRALISIWAELDSLEEQLGQPIKWEDGDHGFGPLPAIAGAFAPSAPPAAQPWLECAGELAHLHAENRRIEKIIEVEFAQVEPDDEPRV